MGDVSPPTAADYALHAANKALRVATAIQGPPKFTDNEIQNQAFAMPIAAALQLGVAQWPTVAAVRPAEDRAGFICCDKFGGPLGLVSYAACDAHIRACYALAKKTAKKSPRQVK